MHTNNFLVPVVSKKLPVQLKKPKTWGFFSWCCLGFFKIDTETPSKKFPKSLPGIPRFFCRILRTTWWQNHDYKLLFKNKKLNKKKKINARLYYFCWLIDAFRPCFHLLNPCHSYLDYSGLLLPRWHSVFVPWTKSTQYSLRLLKIAVKVIIDSNSPEKAKLSTVCW